MRVMEFEQGSDEWFRARAGKITASRTKDMMASGRSGSPSATRAAYLGELIAETLTGNPVSSFQGNADTQRGIELEPAARTAYEIQTGNVVRQVGLVLHPTNDRIAASPDGLVLPGGIEIKCPKPHVHIEYLLAGVPPPAYVQQMGMQALCAELEWVDFVSYCPLMPDDLQLFIVRFTPTMDFLKEIQEAADLFLAELDTKLKKLKEVAAC